MRQSTSARAAIGMMLLLASGGGLNAQSIGYAQALGRRGATCDKDIKSSCNKTNLGGGRIIHCLDQNRAAISATCQASITELQTLLATRAQARAAVPRVCDTDRESTRLNS